jgi:hypothetical protein
VQQAVQPEVQETVQSDVQQAVQPEVQQTVLWDVQKTVQSDVQQAVQPEIQQNVQSDVQQAVQPVVKQVALPEVQQVALPDVSQAVQPDEQMDLQFVANPQTSLQQSPFSKHLATIKKIKLPKAVTGEAFRKIMLEKKALKEQNEREKQERKLERERKRKERDEEKQRKQKEREEKKRQREIEKAEKLKRKALAEKVNQHLAKRKRNDVSSSSDSGSDFQPNDDSEYECDIDRMKCFKCGELYNDDNPLVWISCDNCPRLFHRKCTDIDFSGMDEEDIASFPFECLYC